MYVSKTDITVNFPKLIIPYKIYLKFYFKYLLLHKKNESTLSYLYFYFPNLLGEAEVN